MGKIKRERQKFHITTTDTDKESAKPANKPKKGGKNAANKALLPQLDAVENIFAGINIQLDALNKMDDTPAPQAQPTSAATPTATATEPEERETDAKLNEIQWNYKTTAAEKNLTKKEKLKLKHAKLMEKIDVTHQARIKCQQRRQQLKKSNGAPQSPLPSRAEIKSILTPAATKPTKPPTLSPADEQPEVKNVFAVPAFKDDLPALNIFKINPIKVTDGSKGISKGKNKPKSKQKQNFVKNCNLLKKLMANKKK